VKGFYGCVSDGSFIYFVPNSYNSTYFGGRTLRFDVSKNFTDPASWVRYEIEGIDGFAASTYKGGAFDGKYVYYVVSFLKDVFFVKLLFFFS